MYDIAVLPGDGIGKEVVDEGLKVLNAVADIHGFKTKQVEFPHGSDHYLETGELMPDSVLEEFENFHAIYLGAIGDPRVEVGLVERAVIGGVRWKMDLYINLRPIKLYAEHLCPIKGVTPEMLDILVIRENTEDAYLGIGGFLKQGTPNEVAIQDMVYTRSGVERCIRYAFEACKKRNKQNRLTLVDKANAIRAQDIYTRVFEEVGAEYPNIERDHAYIDAACMWMIKNPDWFDTIVTTNIFGDIITDLGAMCQGGMGIAASGNIHPEKVSMFEPIHGSAPKYRGKNVANPIASIMAVWMMLDFLGEPQAANTVEKAVESLLSSKRIPSLDAKSGLSTTQIGDMVVEEIHAQAKVNG